MDRSLFRRLTRAALWLGLPLLILQPLFGRGSTAVPVGSQPALTVPLFNLWTAWWNADRLSHGLADYWQGPIFHPTAGTFTFSEAQPTLMAVAPIAWWASPTLAYNVYLYLSLVLNGWLAERLLRQIGTADADAAEADNACDWPAICGGVMCLLLPFVHWQFGVLQLVPVWGVLWTLLELDRLARALTLRNGARLGLAFGLTYWLCNYYGLFLSVLLTLAAPVLLARQWRRRRTYCALALAAGVAALTTAPIVCAQWQYLHQWQFQREPASVAGLAATWRDYLTPYGHVWLPLADWFTGPPARWRLNPGYVKTVLALCGLACGLRAPVQRRRTLFWSAFLGAALLLASAPRVGWSGWNLQQGLSDFWPGFAQIRTPYRFAMFAQLAAIVLAVAGLRHAQLRLSRHCPPAIATALTATLALLAMTDVLPWRATVNPVPDVADAAHWSRWVEQHTPPDAVLADIPFARGKSEAEHEVSTRAMFYQTVHHRRLIDGYSGYFPPTFRDLRALLVRFPDAESLDRLALFGASFLIVDEQRLSSRQRAALQDWPQRLQLRYVDAPRSVRIYELSTLRPTPPP